MASWDVVPRLMLGALVALAGCSIDSSAISSGEVDSAVDSTAPDSTTVAMDSSAMDSSAMDTAAPSDSSNPDTASPSDTNPPDTNPPDTNPPDAGPPSTCGNRGLDTGETCDDGNHSDGDGCSAWCESEASYDACPGAPLVIELGEQSYRGDITGAARTQTCGGGVGAGPDSFYSITPNFDGRLDIRLTSTFDGVLMLRSACPGTSGIRCRDVRYAGETEALASDVRAGTTYTVVVSGYYRGDSGTFELRFIGSTP